MDNGGRHRLSFHMTTNRLCTVLSRCIGVLNVVASVVKRKGGPYYHGFGGDLKSLGQTCTQFFPKAGRYEGVLVKMGTILLDLFNLLSPIGPPRGLNHCMHNNLL